MPKKTFLFFIYFLSSIFLLTYSSFAADIPPIKINESLRTPPPQDASDKNYVGNKINESDSIICPSRQIVDIGNTSPPGNCACQYNPITQAFTQTENQCVSDATPTCSSNSFNYCYCYRPLVNWFQLIMEKLLLNPPSQSSDNRRVANQYSSPIENFLSKPLDDIKRMFTKFDTNSTLRTLPYEKQNENKADRIKNAILSLDRNNSTIDINSTILWKCPNNTYKEYILESNESSCTKIRISDLAWTYYQNKNNLPEQTKTEEELIKLFSDSNITNLLTNSSPHTIDLQTARDTLQKGFETINSDNYASAIKVCKDDNCSDLENRSIPLEGSKVSAAQKVLALQIPYKVSQANRDYCQTQTGKNMPDQPNPITFQQFLNNLGNLIGGYTRTQIIPKEVDSAARVRDTQIAQYIPYEKQKEKNLFSSSGSLNPPGSPEIAETGNNETEADIQRNYLLPAKWQLTSTPSGPVPSGPTPAIPVEQEVCNQIKALQFANNPSNFTPLQIIGAIIFQESNGNPSAINPVGGSTGLMQVMPRDGPNPDLNQIFKNRPTTQELLNPNTNIYWGAIKIFKGEKLDYTGNDLDKALNAYYGVSTPIPGYNKTYAELIKSHIQNGNIFSICN